METEVMGDRGNCTQVTSLCMLLLLLVDLIKMRLVRYEVCVGETNAY